MKEKLIEKLVDQYGFSYAIAKEISEEDNSSFILSCINHAYSKGKDSYVDSWRGGSYQ